MGLRAQGTECEGEHTHCSNNKYISSWVSTILCPVGFIPHAIQPFGLTEPLYGGPAKE